MRQGGDQIHVPFEGFEPTAARVTVSARALSLVRVTLPLASLKQKATVSHSAAEVSTSAATNSAAVAIVNST